MLRRLWLGKDFVSCVVVRCGGEERRMAISRLSLVRRGHCRVIAAWRADKLQAA